MDIFDQIGSGAAPKRDIFDEVAPKRSTLLGGENAQIKSAPGFLTNLSQALTAPFHQEREPIAADQPRPGMFGRALENAAAVGKGVLGLANAPFETIAPTVTKYAGENLPIEPRTAEAIGNAAGVVAQGSILPWRSRAPLTPARNIEDLIAAPRPGLPAPPEQLGLPPPQRPPLLEGPRVQPTRQAQSPMGPYTETSTGGPLLEVSPNLETPGGATMTGTGQAQIANKRTIVDLIDEVKQDVKQKVIDEIFQELRSGRPQAAAGAPKQAAPLSIEDLRGQLAPEARATQEAPTRNPRADEGRWFTANGEAIDQSYIRANPNTPREVPSMVKEATPPKMTAAEYRTAQKKAEMAPLPPRETITPSQDTKVGQNAAGEQLYERADGSRYRIRQDRKDRPNGFPDFGGDLRPIEQPSSPAAPYYRGEGLTTGHGKGPLGKGVYITPDKEYAKAFAQDFKDVKGKLLQYDLSSDAKIVSAESEIGQKIISSKFPEQTAKDLGVDGVSSSSNVAGKFKGKPETVIYNSNVLREPTPTPASQLAPEEIAAQQEMRGMLGGKKPKSNVETKTRLDLMLDKVKSNEREVTFDVRDYAEADKSRIIEAAEKRGLHASSDGNHILVRDMGRSEAAPRTIGDLLKGEKGQIPPEQNPLPGERKMGDIIGGEKGAIHFGSDKEPKVFGPPIEPPEARGGIQSPKFDFSKWNDKAALSLSRETLERNIAGVAPAEDAAKVDKFIVQPVRQNETNRINFNNSLKTETRGAVVEKLGIKAGSKEDALTQAYGEGRLPLDELKTLTPNWQKVVSASDYFRSKYDTLLDTVNAARAKFGYEPIPKRADYFRHFQDIDNIIKNFGVILRTEDLPTEISGLTEGFKPGKPFSTAELQRKGGSYTMSAIRGFDNYIDSISKQIFHIDSVQRARGLEKYIREAAGAENAKLPNLVANLHEYGNLLAGKKATFDRAFESLFGRKFYAAVNVLRGRTSANMVGGNVGSALTNFIPFTQAAATTNKGSLAKAMLQATMAPFEKDPAAIDGIASSFLQRRYPEGAISPTIGDKLKSGANFLFDTVDKFTARSVVGGKYYEGIGNGLSPKEAMAAADTYAGKVLTDRSLGQLPNLFNVKTLGPITQFQTEINNMYSFVTKDIPALSGSKAKTVKALSEFFLYSYLFNSGFEKVTGRRPTIDPIHFLITLAGDGDIKQKLGALNQDIISNLPLVGGISGGRLPISAGMPDAAGMIKGEKSIVGELSKPAFFLAPPFGGLQAKKTIEGASAYNAGQVRSASGNKKLFDIEQSPENLVRSILFGKYASPQAREYFDSGQLTPRQKLLKDLGLKDMGKDRAEKRREMLNKLGLER